MHAMSYMADYSKLGKTRIISITAVRPKIVSGTIRLTLTVDYNDEEIFTKYRLNDHVPANDERDEFSHRHVRVDVGRAGGGHAGPQLRVAHR